MSSTNEEHSSPPTRRVRFADTRLADAKDATESDETPSPKTNRDSDASSEDAAEGQAGCSVRRQHLTSTGSSGPPSSEVDDTDAVYFGEDSDYLMLPDFYEDL